MTDDESAFRKIYDDFQPKLLRYLKHLVGDDDAEDLTQEVFAKVSRGLGSFRGDSNLSTWLYRIATNTALDRLRSPSFRHALQKDWPGNPTASVDAEIEDGTPWTGKSEPLVEQQVYRKEMNECVREYIARLPKNYRTVLVLSDLEGLKIQEIAEILQISSGAVKIRLHRARERLKKELAGHCDPYWVEDNEFVPELKRPDN